MRDSERPAAGNDLVDALSRFCAKQSEGNAAQAQVQQNQDAIASLQKQVTDLVNAQATHEQISSSRLQTLDNRMADLANKVWTVGQSSKEGTDKVQSLEAASQALGKQMEALQRDLGDKACLADLQSVRSVVTGNTDSVTSIQEALEEKVGTPQIQQLLHVVEGVEQEVKKLSETVFKNHEKVAENLAAQRKVDGERLDKVNLSVGDLKKTLQNKADLTDIQQMRSSHDGLATKHSMIEKTLHGKVDRANVDSIDQAVQQLQASLPQQVENTVKGVQQHIMHVEQALHEKAEISQLQQLQSLVNDKVTMGQLQGVSGLVANVENKLSLVELAIEMKADRAYVDTELQGKAGEMYVNADFDKKRLKAYVDGEMQKKADISYVRTELDMRPVKEEVANAVMSVLPTLSHGPGTPRGTPQPGYR